MKLIENKEQNPVREILNQAIANASETNAIIIGIMTHDGQININALARNGGQAPIALLKFYIDYQIQELMLKDAKRG